jgi:hypothetical protein
MFSNLPKLFPSTGIILTHMRQAFGVILVYEPHRNLRCLPPEA